MRALGGGQELFWSLVQVDSDLGAQKVCSVFFPTLQHFLNQKQHISDIELPQTKRMTLKNI